MTSLEQAHINKLLSLKQEIDEFILSKDYDMNVFARMTKNFTNFYNRGSEFIQGEYHHEYCLQFGDQHSMNAVPPVTNPYEEKINNTLKSKWRQKTVSWFSRSGRIIFNLAFIFLMISAFFSLNLSALRIIPITAAIVCVIVGVLLLAFQNRSL